MMNHIDWEERPVEWTIKFVLDPRLSMVDVVGRIVMDLWTGKGENKKKT